MKYLKFFLMLIVLFTFVGCGEEPSPTPGPIDDPTPIEEKKEYTVEFYVDGVMIDSQKVLEGESATKPADPKIEGMVFDGWDTDFTNVHSDLFVSAIFSKEIIKYKATFKVDGEVYEVVEVEEGNSLVYPTNPTKEHFEFVGWDKADLGKLTEDVEINALFEEVEFLVSFYLDGALIHSEYVAKGEAAKEFELPIPEGREFVSWDKEFSCVMEKMDIYGTTDIDRTLDREEISKAVTELDEYFSSLTYPLIDGDVIDFKGEVGSVKVSWTSSNEQIILSTGRVKQPYTAKKAEEVTLTATLDSNGYKLNHLFTVTVKRGYKSLDKGVNAVYNNGGSSLSEPALSTYDIVYYAFLGFSGSLNGSLSNASTVIANVNGYKDQLHAHGGRVMVSLVAQGDQANTMRTLIKNETALNTLVTNLVNLVVDNDLDGIDIDWESPGDDGAKSYTVLVKALYTALKAADPHYLLTSAVMAGPWQYNKYDFKNSAQYHDYINMMAYDMQDASKATFQNALYYKSGACAGGCSIEETIGYYNSVGVKNEQIIVGVPFYGRRSPNATALGSSCGSNTAIVQSTINDHLKSGTYVRYFDDTCKVPYLLDVTNHYFVTYEDQESIDWKYKFIKEKGLAGMMAWQYRQDYNDKLTLAMRSAKNKYMG